jgi:hypothetical protein
MSESEFAASRETYASVTSMLYALMRAFDEGDLEQLTAFLAEDVTLDFCNHKAAGRPDAMEFFQAGLAKYAATSHHLSNVTVRFHGDRNAEMSSYVYAYYRRLHSEEIFELWAEYRDHVIRDDSGRWLLQHRTFRVRATVERRPPRWCAGSDRKSSLRRRAMPDSPLMPPPGALASPVPRRRLHEATGDRRTRPRAAGTAGGCRQMSLSDHVWRCGGGW